MNDAIVSLDYYLPRYGALDVKLGPYTSRLWHALDDHHHLVRRTKTMPQLGNLTYFYPGAHHTRYEYMILQWHLYSVLASLKDSTLPLHAHVTYPAIKNAPFRHPAQDVVRGEDLLQSWVLLANVSHLPETLAAERAVLHFLLQSGPIQQIFLRGLGEGGGLAAGCLTRRDAYDLHHFLFWLWLEREKGRHTDPAMTETLSYATMVLEYFLDREAGPQAEQRAKLRGLFDAVRPLAYLALDTLYTPAPFSIELGAVLADIRRDFTAYLEGEAPFQRALARLDALMRELVYQAPEAMISMRRVTQERLKRLQGVAQSLRGIDDLADCWYPPNVKHPRHQILVGPLDEALPSRSTVQGFRFPVGNGQTDWVEEETGLERQTGPGTLVALDYDANDHSVGVAVDVSGCKTPAAGLHFLRGWLRALTARAHLNVPPHEPEGVSMLSWALSQIVRSGLVISTWDYRDRVPDPPVFLTEGGTTASAELNAWLDRFRERLAPSEVAEVTLLASTAADVSPQSSVLAFGGSVRVHDGSDRRVAEVDGVLLIASDTGLDAVLIESKTGRHAGDAASALRQKLPRLFVAAPEVPVDEVEGGAIVRWPVLPAMNTRS